MSNESGVHYRIDIESTWLSFFTTREAADVHAREVENQGCDEVYVFEVVKVMDTHSGFV